MFNSLLSSTKIPHVIQGSTPEGTKEKQTIKKYHKYFRQRDTLLNIPKILEAKVKNEDPEAYELAKQEAAERLDAIKDSRTETLPVYDKDYGLTKVSTNEGETP